MDREILALRKVQSDKKVKLPAILQDATSVIFEQNEDGEIIVRPNHGSDK